MEHSFLRYGRKHNTFSTLGTVIVNQPCKIELDSLKHRKKRSGYKESERDRVLQLVENLHDQLKNMASPRHSQNHSATKEYVDESFTSLKEEVESITMTHDDPKINEIAQKVLANAKETVCGKSK